MRQKMTLFFALVFLAGAVQAQTIAVERFHKIVVSPYIQASFVQGDEESVTVNSMIVDSNKLHVEVNHGELRLYLDGAKDVPHNERDYDEHGHERYYHFYPNHAVVVTITYKKLDVISVRGTEKYVCLSPLASKSFSLRMYGESTMIFTEVHFGKMYTHLYGRSSVDIRSGDVIRQYYTCYGEGKVNSTAIGGRAAKLTAFGEAEFMVNVSDRIKVTSFGEAKLRYRGDPVIVKGIHIGGVDMQRIN